MDGKLARFRHGSTPPRDLPDLIRRLMVRCAAADPAEVAVLQAYMQRLWSRKTGLVPRRG